MYAQTPPWYFINTGVENTHIVLVIEGTPITIDGVQMEVGDYFAAFYLFNDTMLCGTGTGSTGDIGGTMVTSSVSAATVWGSEPNVHNGFQDGEELKWKVWRASDGSVFSAVATYDTSVPSIPDSGFFVTNGLSKMASLTAFSIPGIDLSVNQQMTPVSGCGSQNEQSVSVLLENHDTLDVIGFTVNYTLNDGDTVSEFVNDTIFAHSTFEYTFNQTLTLTDVGDYFFHVWVNYPGDVNYTNDYNNKHIVISEFPELSLGEDLAICYGDSVVFQTDSFFNEYIWSTGSTQQYIFASQEGAYSVTVTDELGCNVSDTVNLTVYPMPDLGLGYEIEFCEGSYTNVTIIDRYQSIQWSNGSQKPNLYISYPGTYWVTATDFAGCEGHDSIIVNEIPMPLVNLGDDIYTFQYDTLTLDAGAGFDDYLWNTGETSQTIIPDHFGKYEVTVSDGSCPGYGKIDIFEDDTIKSIDYILFYPNPAINTMRLVFPLSESVTIEIFDIAGKYISSTSLNNLYTTKFDIRYLHAGVYILKLKADNYTFIKRFVKIN